MFLQDSPAVSDQDHDLLDTGSRRQEYVVGLEKRFAGGRVTLGVVSVERVVDSPIQRAPVVAVRHVTSADIVDV